MEKRKYDSTVARIAGNIAPSFVAVSRDRYFPADKIATESVRLARLIVAEVERTEAHNATV